MHGTPPPAARRGGSSPRKIRATVKPTTTSPANTRQNASAGVSNPIVPGYYADPEIRRYGGRCWIYATRSFTDYALQRNLDAFSSVDLATWEKHPDIIAADDFPWIEKAVWAPTIINQGGNYYLVFASNDITASGQMGGLEIAVADKPEGPFRGYLGRPLLNTFVNGAQPIDAHLFRDTDGTVYLYYGGWDHCNVARMNDDMTGFRPFADGETFKEISPEGYREAPCMVERGGIYYFMWSSGNWANGTYRVSCANARNPLGPFVEGETILASQPGVAEGPGHHSCLRLGDSDEWLVAYHRRIVGERDPGARVLCLDRMAFRGERIAPIEMTDRW